MKPVVFYSGEPNFRSTSEGEYALVFALNHPRLGRQSVRTSLVLSKQDNGFETLNTLYRKNTWPFPTAPLPVYVEKTTKTNKLKQPEGFEEALM
jgi:hypothetical protein